MWSPSLLLVVLSQAFLVAVPPTSDSINASDADKKTGPVYITLDQMKATISEVLEEKMENITRNFEKQRELLVKALEESPTNCAAALNETLIRFIQGMESNLHGLRLTEVSNLKAKESSERTSVDVDVVNSESILLEIQENVHKLDKRLATLEEEIKNTTDKSDFTISGHGVMSPVTANASAGQARINPREDFIVTCDVEGYPAPKVLWLKDGQVMAPDKRIQFTGKHVLRISESTVADTGKYTCQASNQLDTVGSAVDITVPDTPPDPECVDSPNFDNCALIVRARYCSNKFYLKYCCKSCYLDGQISSQEE